LESDRGVEAPRTSRICHNHNGDHRDLIIKESEIYVVRWLLDETDKSHFWGMNEATMNDTATITTSSIIVNHINASVDHYNLAVAIKIALLFEVIE
jgi:hypothetical protein